MSAFELGQEVEIDDPKRPWAHGEVGRIIGVWPHRGPPERFDVLVAGRSLLTTSDNLREVG